MNTDQDCGQERVRARARIRERRILSLQNMAGALARRVAFPGRTEEAFQSGMEGVCQAVDSWNGSGTLGGWAYARIRGAILDDFRRGDVVSRCKRRDITAAQREVEEHPNNVSLELRKRAVSPVVTPYAETDILDFGVTDRGYAAVDNEIDVADAMTAIHGRDYDVVRAYYWDQRSLLDIAGEYGVTEGRICQILTKARAQLRQRLVVS